MTFKQLLASQAFFTTFIKNETFFNSLKEKFPEILADLTSSRNNPNCSCKNRVKIHLTSKLESQSMYFENLINTEEIKQLIEQKTEEIKNSQFKNPMEEHMKFTQESMFKNSGGRVFEIGKTQEDWKNLCKRIEIERVIFKSFSIIEKEDKLIVYFI